MVDFYVKLVGTVNIPFRPMDPSRVLLAWIVLEMFEFGHQFRQARIGTLHQLILIFSVNLPMF